MPSALVVSFNIADLPWPFEDEQLAAIPNRIQRIADELGAYQYRLLQEDWFQRIEGRHCGRWYCCPSGLTLGSSAGLPLGNESSGRYRRAGCASGDWLARKGWQLAYSQGVAFAHTHLDAGDEDRDVRQEQAQRLRDALPTSGPLVLGGDFNTENPTERDWMDANFADIGLARVQLETAKGKDHFYVRELQTPAFGIDEPLSNLSDHPAIWLKIQWGA